MTLVETFSGETNAEFRAAVDAVLQAISPDRPNWWHPYDVRGTYECRGVRFREFSCIAGSVEAWLWLSTTKGGTRRVIVVPDESATVFGDLTMVGAGRETVVAASEIVAIRSGGTTLMAVDDVHPARRDKKILSDGSAPPVLPLWLQVVMLAAGLAVGAVVIWIFGYLSGFILFLRR